MKSTSSSSAETICPPYDSIAFLTAVVFASPSARNRFPANMAAAASGGASKSTEIKLSPFFAGIHDKDFPTTFVLVVVRLNGCLKLPTLSTSG